MPIINSIAEQEMWGEKDFESSTITNGMGTFYYDRRIGKMTQVPCDKFYKMPLCEAEFINNNEKSMYEQTPAQFAEAKTLTTDEALLREMGLKDSNGKYTTAYGDLRRFKANQEFEHQAIAVAKEMKEVRKLEIKKDEVTD